MGGVPTCSLYHIGAFKLAVLGNCYNIYVAKALVALYGHVILKLWTELIERLFKIGRAFFSDSFLNLNFVLEMSGNIIIDIVL